MGEQVANGAGRCFSESCPHDSTPIELYQAKQDEQTRQGDAEMASVAILSTVCAPYCILQLRRHG
jgi:hypothetical protein